MKKEDRAGGAAVATGAGRGIGRVVAERLVAEGAAVAPIEWAGP